MSSKQLRFDDKVVIVTGAGGGLGRSYALDYAKRGAKVVVNDLGGADAVVAEIKAAGGTAVADKNNVLDGDKIVQTALDSFGAVHVIINNAGILRDIAFKNMDDAKFKLVVDVHVKGAYKVTKAAWPHFKKQNYGRILNTSSPAGLYGNFGQANYSAAKSALVGFTETLAKEGAKYNILVSAIAPTARSKMTEGLLPPQVLEKVSPEYITPLVVYLTHDSFKTSDSGRFFELAGGYYAQSRWERSSGELFHPDDSFTAEALLSKIDSIKDFSSSKSFKPIEYPTAPADYIKLTNQARKLPTPNPQGSKKVSLKNQVVLITGAGAGLGRAHALWLAKYGAKVVVNDIANATDVVNEIKAQGGDAHVDHHNAATDAEAIIKNVLDKYGRIDAVINNAGILRDKSFQNMTEKQWDDVFAVHLWGTYKLSKAVWPIFSKQGGGRIVNITSTSGIYGSFGQANYSAAKMAVLGLSRTLAIEGKKNNIVVNIVAPHAETAMTKTIFRKEEYNLFPPELVSPILVLLASEQAPSTGDLYEIGGGWVGLTRYQTAAGATAKPGEKVDAEFIASHWNEITDFSHDTVSNDSIGETVQHILAKLSGDDDEDDDDDEDEDDDDDSPKDTVDSKGNPTYSYGPREVILYNLGVGSKATDLQFTYENDKHFQVIPTFGTVITQNIKRNVIFEDANKILKNFNPVMLLHGEQYLRIEQWPIPTEATVATESFPVAVVNKGKSAILTFGSNTYDTASGKPIFYNEMTTFNRGAQSKEGNKIFKKRAPFAVKSFDAPKTEPDFIAVVETSVDQAAIYRLSGDYNPLHIDPKFAKSAGFNRPILHGLGYLGVSVKTLLEHYGPIKEVKARFSGSVFPGDRLKISTWKQGNVILFEVFNLSTNNKVISNAAISLVGDSKKL